MVFNPLLTATPQQQEELAKAQQFTKHIKYIVHTDEGKVEFTLQTDKPQSAQLIPQLLEGIVASVTQMLYTLYAMEGERI
jgi:hypothetical protein